jgi:hypothetical protein
MCGVEASVDKDSNVQNQEWQMLLLEYLFKSLPAWAVIILILIMLIGPSGPKK